jgi:hypothetical protein
MPAERPILLPLRRRPHRLSTLHAKGSYRLARLAAKYGAEIPMMELLAHLAGDCAIWDTRHPGAPRCGAYFVDLDFPAPPPDRPTEGMRHLRLVEGGGA